jgi:hypothetical protein
MLRLIVLTVLFLVALYVGFWLVVAPMAVTIRLIDWQNRWAGQGQDIAVGSAGLIGGVIIAALATRFAAKKWST